MAVIRHGSAAGTDGFTTIKVAGQSDIVADSTSDNLTFVNGSNITITTDAGTDSVTIASSGGSGGGGGDSFKTISVSGEDDVVAAGDDTLTLVAGSNITITTVAGSDTITVASADTQLTQEQVEDFVNGVIVGGTNITATYDDAAGTLTLVGTDTNTQLTQEQVEDYVNGVIVGGTNITATYDDAAGTLTLVGTDTNTQTESFKTISVSGEDDVVADSSTDTLTLAAGSNVTITTNAGSDTITVASADTNTQLTQEQVEDFVDGVIVAGSNITKTYDDAAGTLTIAATGGGGGGSDTFKTIAVSGQDDVVASGDDTLTLAAGANVTLTTTAGTDTVTIAASGGGGGGDAFKTISVSGEDDVVADSSTDTLTLAAGSNVTITTTAGSDTVTFASADTNTQLTQEQVEDFVNGVIVGGTNVTSTYDDAAGTLTLSSTDTNTQTESFKTISVSGQDDVVADSSTDTLTLAAGSNVTITTTAGSDTVTIASADTNTQTESFKTISVSGQDDVVADSSTDTLTLAAGSNITITTTAGSDTITIAASGGGGGGGWTDDGSTVRLTTAGDDVGVGTATANEKLTVDGVVSLKTQASAASATADYAKIYTREYGNDSNTKLLLHMDGANDGSTFTDSSVGGSASISLGGTPLTKTAVKKFGTASGYFVAGEGDKIILGTDVTDFEFGSGDFTVECWFNQTAGGGVWANPLIGNGTGAGATSNWKIYCGDKVNGYLFEGSTGHHVQSTTSIADGLWHHVAFVRNGVFLQLFIDGKLESLNNIGTVSSNDHASSVCAVGEDGAGTYYSGYIDEMAITKGVANYTENFTPAKSAFPTTNIVIVDSNGGEYQLGKNW